MFHFGKKKASVPELVLSAENIELYRGPLSDIPLSEKTILAWTSTKTLSLAIFIVVLPVNIWLQS